MSEKCPTELELDRAVSIGVDPELASHLERCQACRSLWDETESALELARELPIDLPPAHHRQEQRAAILAVWNPVPQVAPEKSDVEAPPARSPRWLVPAFVGAVVAATIVVAVVVRSTPPDEIAAPIHPRRGVVNPHDGALFTLASQPPDEIVRLRDGVIDIDVDPLAAGERFRVVIGTDEIEVHGTSFQVAAVGDQLSAVRVVHGRVAVKRTNAAVVVLGPGEAWRRATTTTSLVPSAPEPLSPPKPTPPRVPHVVVDSPSPPAAARPARNPQEVVFVQGWEAMRRGEFGQAATAFGRAIALAPNGALAEDDTFWHAVAVARLHRASEAIAALRAFLAAFPTSTRAGEASAMLGWLLVDRRELDEARRRFQAAENDPNASARASARRGLASLIKPN